MRESESSKCILTCFFFFNLLFVFDLVLIACISSAKESHMASSNFKGEENCNPITGLENWKYLKDSFNHCYKQVVLKLHRYEILIAVHGKHIRVSIMSYYGVLNIISVNLCLHTEIILRFP